jgi:hypothetical protein
MKCPSCGLANFADAAACRRCGTAFAGGRAPSVAPAAVVGAPAPLAPPLTGAAPAVRIVFARGDSAVEVPLTGFTLPALCCKCGTPSGLAPRSEALTRVSFGYAILAVVLFPLGVGTWLLARAHQSARFVFPVCLGCDGRWRTANIVNGAAFVLPFVLGFVAGKLWPGHDGTHLLAGLATFVASMALLRAITLRAFLRPAAITIVSIDDDAATLAGFAAPVRDALARPAPEPSPFVSEASRPSGAARVFATILTGFAVLFALPFYAILGIYAFRKYEAAHEHVWQVQDAYDRCMATADALDADKSALTRPIPMGQSIDVRKDRHADCYDRRNDCLDDYDGQKCKAFLQQGNDAPREVHVTVPAGFASINVDARRCSEIFPGSTCLAGYRGEGIRRGDLGTVILVADLGHEIARSDGRTQLVPGLAPKKGTWKGFDIDIVHGPTKIEGRDGLVYAALIPLSPHAIAITVVGDSSTDTEMGEMVDGMVQSVEGPRNWKTSEEVGALIRSWLLRLLVFAAVFVLAGAFATRWVWRSLRA